NTAIPVLAGSIRENRREGAFHILMLHTDIEGYQRHGMAGLSSSVLRELRSVTEYVALGHTHMHYEIENWAFNPGSIEITNIAEYKETRGVFVVEVDDNNNVNAKHIEDYTYRPFQRIPFSVDNIDDPKAITDGVLEQVRLEGHAAEPGKPQP